MKIGVKSTVISKKSINIYIIKRVVVLLMNKIVVFYFGYKLKYFVTAELENIFTGELTVRNTD